MFVARVPVEVFAEIGVRDAGIWSPDDFRLFLSHVSTIKEKTTGLRSALLQYGTQGFLAHVDIEPTREWQTSESGSRASP